MIAYRDTFAGKGSQLYDAIQAGNQKLAAQIYAITTASYYALLNDLSVPKLWHGTEGKSRGMWAVVATDAEYDQLGRYVSGKATA